MTPRTRRQLGIAIVLVALLVAVSIYRGGADAPPAGAPVASSTGASGTSGTQPQQQAVADLKLEMLSAERREAIEAERNPFRFEARTPPPAPAPAGAPRRAVQPEPEVPQGPPAPPPIPLRLIGLLTAPTQAGRVAVLSDGRGNVFHGREGDIIEGRYRLLTIGADSAELAYTDGRGRQTIRLSGQ